MFFVAIVRLGVVLPNFYGRKLLGTASLLKFMPALRVSAHSKPWSSTSLGALVYGQAMQLGTARAVKYWPFELAGISKFQV